MRLFQIMVNAYAAQMHFFPVVQPKLKNSPSKYTNACQEEIDQVVSTALGLS